MVTAQEKIDVLKMARGFIQEPDAWMKEWHAQNHIGQETGPTEPDAVCFCLEGAIIRALSELLEVDEDELLLKEINDEVMSKNEDSMVIWNDSPQRTHAQVLARVDATLERLEREAIAS